MIIRNKRLKKTKKCIVCGKTKLREYFYTTPLAIDGLRSWCKVCWTKGRNINNWKKAGKIIEEVPNTNGTKGNLFIPKENIRYLIVIPSIPRRKYTK